MNVFVLAAFITFFRATAAVSCNQNSLSSGDCESIILQVDPDSFPKDIGDFLNTKITEKLKKLAEYYTSEVDKIITDVESTPMKDIATTIAKSERLGRLTQTVLETITNIEQVIDEYESVLSRQDFKIRQEYNVARYKLDTSVSEHHWDYYGRSNYVWAG